MGKKKGPIHICKPASATQIRESLGISEEDAAEARKIVDKVVDYDGITRLDVSPDRILKKAIGELKGVVILGYDKEDEEYFASSYADGGEVIWLLEKCKKELLEQDG